MIFFTYVFLWKLFPQLSTEENIRVNSWLPTLFNMGNSSRNGWKYGERRKHMRDVMLESPPFKAAIFSKGTDLFSQKIWYSLRSFKPPPIDQQAYPTVMLVSFSSKAQLWKMDENVKVHFHEAIPIYLVNSVSLLPV